MPSRRRTIRNRLFVLCALVIALAMAGCVGRGPGARELLQDAPRVKRTILANGLTVYTVANPAVPLVTLDMWVRVGSKDEPTEHAGASHFLEHMLFKGTPRLPVGEYDRRIEALGGYLNAATSSDYTHYYLIVPAEKMDDALVDLADVMVNSTIDEHEVERERQVILEEIRQKQDNPVGFLFDEITRSAYEQSPYAGTVIGTSESVGGMSRATLHSHYTRFYAPSNMALMVVGDIDEGAVVARLRELFADFDRPLEPWRETPPETKFTPPTAREWQRDWRQTYFFLTFPGGAVPSVEKLAAADVAETLLFGGRSSRVVNALREKKRLVTSITGFMPSHRFPSFGAVYGTCDPDKVDAATEALFEELDRVRDGDFSGEELARAKRQIVVHHLYHSETNTGKASMLGYSYALFGDSRLYDRYPEAVEAVTRDAVRAELDGWRRGMESRYVARPATNEN